MSVIKNVEVIDLDSDEESAPKSEADNNKDNNNKKSCNTNCVNFKCSSGVDMSVASPFACSFYGANALKKKRRLICKDCLNTCLDHQDVLVSAFLDHKPILKCDIPDHSMEVEISDSDESDKENPSKDEDEVLVPEEDFTEFKNRIDQVLPEIIDKYDLKYQVDESHKSLKEQWDAIIDSNQALDDEIKAIVKRLDKVRAGLYDEFKPQITMEKELDMDEIPMNQASRMPHLSSVLNQAPVYQPIQPPRPVQLNTYSSPNIARKKTCQPSVRGSVPSEKFRMVEQRLKFLQPKIENKMQPPVIDETIQDNQPDIMQIDCELDVAKLGLPEDKPFTKPVLEVDDFAFIMKHQLVPWVKAKIVSVLSRNPLQYRVKLIPKKYASQMKNLSGKFVATTIPCNVMIPVGTRVVAVFQDVYTSNHYSGVVAEPPRSWNKCRYLVFFDDGYAQYVKKDELFVVCESSPRVWEDVPNESKEFIRKYMETYPERPMVKLQVGQVLKTEWNGRWWIARVAQVDASLVQMHFDADNRTEWIYRGSARLGPLYLELMKANRRQQGMQNLQPRRPQNPSKNRPYVEYTYNTDNYRPPEKAAPAPGAPPPQAAPTQSRAVAKKSTAKKPTVEPPQQSSANNSNNNNNVGNIETRTSHSIVYFRPENKVAAKKYVLHTCGEQCSKSVSFTPDDLRGFSPLSIPLLCGWNRQLCKFPKGKKTIMYETPCGLRVRNYEELHQYLRMTKNKMSVDLFDFDTWVHCLAEFMLDKCFVNVKFDVTSAPMNKCTDTSSYAPTENMKTIHTVVH